MNTKICIPFLGTICMIGSFLYGQGDTNCFLIDHEPKTAVIPEAEEAEKPVERPSVKVTFTGDTLGKVSGNVYGNAIAAWAGAHDNPVLIEGIERLAPTLIRFPGGSWSNGYFWNRVPSDVPDSIYDGTTYNGTTHTAKKNKFYGHDGTEGWVTSAMQYYALRNNTGVNEGLITINYGYARYGTSEDPVAQAAHLAADWVRYDAGRTKFWEIGNENGGPWEYGWMIDTALNKDGQPQIISGELYGKHFKVFVDSMKAAAAEIGTAIYIGGQVVIDGPSSWNFVDRNWNEGFFKEAANKADFYVVHAYFGTNYQVKNLLDIAASEPKRQIDFLKQDYIKYNAYPKPVALTEYGIGLGATATQQTSYINGMQAVILWSEFIKNNYGLGARWLLLSGETTMFYGGSDADYLYHPHADFYYLTYLQKYYGDHAISAMSSNKDILCYGSKYSSGETSMIIVNIGTDDRVITVSTDSVGVGEKYYVYSFTGGTDDDFSPDVYINGEGPGTDHWGPYDELFDIKANMYTIDREIKFTSPARSVQMILIDKGTDHIHVDDSVLVGIDPVIAGSFRLYQNFPNPVHLTTRIAYQLPENAFVTLTIFDFQGREIATLVNQYQNAGYQSVQFHASDLPGGVYFYRIEAGKYHDTKRLIILK
ncbi:MAG: T9SS type A sorting domain-containing protein [Bacteroidales bacterium]|nr:T9SS type A sorting domain-containing protein [Bacteroidales bacterium]